jgi:hypothetical protein
LIAEEDRNFALFDVLGAQSSLLLKCSVQHVRMHRDQEGRLDVESTFSMHGRRRYRCFSVSVIEDPRYRSVAETATRTGERLFPPRFLHAYKTCTASSGTIPLRTLRRIE